MKAIHQPARPRLDVRLRSREDLRRAMHFNRLNVREMAQACGNPRYRSTIGHLHSGARRTCSPHLARRIEEVLRMHAGALFELTVVSTANTDNGQAVIPNQSRRRAAA